MNLSASHLKQQNSIYDVIKIINKAYLVRKYRQKTRTITSYAKTNSISLKVSIDIFTNPIYLLIHKNSSTQNYSYFLFNLLNASKSVSSTQTLMSKNAIN